jgi:hypothetical protein
MAFRRIVHFVVIFIQKYRYQYGENRVANPNWKKFTLEGQRLVLKTHKTFLAAKFPENSLKILAILQKWVKFSQNKNIFYDN